MQKAIIIGAGLSGCLTAIFLRKHAIETLLLEKNNYENFPLPETTGCSASDLETLLDLPKDHLQAYFSKRYTVNLLDENDMHVSQQFTGDLPSGFYQVNRYELDKALAEIVISRGAQINHGSVVHSIETRSDESSVIFKELGEYKRKSAKYIVDASGKVSLTSQDSDNRCWGEDFTASHTVFTHIEHKVACELFVPGTINYLDLGEGYLFIIPITLTRFAVGVVSSKETDERTNQAHFNEVIAQIDWLKSIITQAKQCFPVVKTLNKAFINDLTQLDFGFVVGDALGFYDPKQSDGITRSIQSAQQTAQSIVELETVLEPEKVYEEYVKTMLTTQKKTHFDVKPVRASTDALTWYLDDPHLPLGFQSHEEVMACS